SQNARVMVVGQAPGASEGKLGYPFGGDAGGRLFKWLGRAGWEENAFRETHYITSVTKCFPGTNPRGGGDRVPTAAEQRLCRQWLDAELALVKPEVILPVGILAIRVFYDTGVKLAEVVGESKIDPAGRLLVPLPHPSGASRWLNDPRNAGRLEQAIFLLRIIRIEKNL
nr:uracil-DNA glycosylase [Anaerolineae bacterium]